MDVLFTHRLDVVTLRRLKAALYATRMMNGAVNDAVSIFAVCYRLELKVGPYFFYTRRP